MKTVKTILKNKGSVALSADRSVPVRDALRTMTDNNVGSVLVTSNGRLVGLLTERDFVRAVAATGETPLGSVVGDIMETDVLFVSPETTTEECMALMTENRTRHLPVIEGEELVGIVSIGDVVKDLIDDKEFLIEQLERYITGH
jgi:CBS domain-containing protein